MTLINKKTQKISTIFHFLSQTNLHFNSLIAILPFSENNFNSGLKMKIFWTWVFYLLITYNDVNIISVQLRYFLKEIFSAKLVA